MVVEPCLDWCVSTDDMFSLVTYDCLDGGVNPAIYFYSYEEIEYTLCVYCPNHLVLKHQSVAATSAPMPASTPASAPMSASASVSAYESESASMSAPVSAPVSAPAPVPSPDSAQENVTDPSKQGHLLVHFALF
jgi:hypothetical protein